MLTIIWLIFTTAIGYAIGYFWFESYIFLCTFIGFIVGLLLRFGAGSDSGGGFDFSGGSDGGGDGD